MDVSCLTGTSGTDDTPYHWLLDLLILKETQRIVFLAAHEEFHFGFL